MVKLPKPTKKQFLIALVITLAIFFIFPGKMFSFVTNTDSPDVKILTIYDVNHPSIGQGYSGGTTNANLNVDYTLLLHKSANLNIQLAEPTVNECLDSYGVVNQLCVVSKNIVSTLRSGNDKVDTVDYEYLFLVKYSATANGVLVPEFKDYEATFYIDYKNKPVTFRSLVIKDAIKCTENEKCNEISISPNPPTTINVENLGNRSYATFSTRINNLPFNTVYTQKFYLTIRSTETLDNFYVDGVNPDQSYGTQKGVDNQRQQSSLESLWNAGSSGLLKIVGVFLLVLLAVVVLVMLLAFAWVRIR